MGQLPLSTSCLPNPGWFSIPWKEVSGLPGSEDWLNSCLLSVPSTAFHLCVPPMVSMEVSSFLSCSLSLHLSFSFLSVNLSVCLYVSFSVYTSLSIIVFCVSPHVLPLSSYVLFVVSTYLDLLLYPPSGILSHLVDKPWQFGGNLLADLLYPGVSCRPSPTPMTSPCLSLIPAQSWMNRQNSPAMAGRGSRSPGLTRAALKEGRGF